MSKLLPCPFCGSAMEIPEREPFSSYRIRHPRNDRCPLDQMTIFEDYGEAFEHLCAHWNQRTDTARAAELEAEVGRLQRNLDARCGCELDEDGETMLTWCAAHSHACHRPESVGLREEMEQLRSLLARAYKHHTTTSLPLCIERYGDIAKCHQEGRRLWLKDGEIAKYLEANPGPPKAGTD